MTWAFVMERVTRIELALSGPARPAVDRVFPLLRARCGHGFENGRQPRHVHQPAINMIEIKAIQPIKHFYAFLELLANSSEFTRINRNSNLFLRNMPGDR